MADTKNMFYVTQLDNLRDPVRTTRWRVLIPSDVFKASGLDVTNGDQFNKSLDGTDNFALHVKDCQLPSITTETKPQWYMGFESAHVTNTKLSGDMNFKTILLEDMRAYEAMFAWQQATLNTGLLVTDKDADRMSTEATYNLGLGLGAHKDAKSTASVLHTVRNSNVKVELYNWLTGDVILTVSLINAIPTKVGDGVNLNYQNADLANFGFTLHYDRWTIKIPKGYKS